MPQIELLNVDCMEFMRSLPDKCYDLAIVDPPYGLPKKSIHGRGDLKYRALNKGAAKMTGWDVAPGSEFFGELFRVSADQIIWGGNHFLLPPCRGPIIWDKCQPWENFAQVEIAWSSFDYPAQLFRFDPKTGGKIHPTQKPVALYRWLLQNYAKPGQRILDTHGGSMSIAIACDIEGYDLTLCEIDKDYFEAGSKRLEAHRSAPRLFDAPAPQAEQLPLL